MADFGITYTELAAHDKEFIVGQDGVMFIAYNEGAGVFFVFCNDSLDIILEEYVDSFTLEFDELEDDDDDDDDW